MYPLSAFGVIHKVWPLPSGVVAHGTGFKAAKNIARTGLKETQGRLGLGAYTTKDATSAQSFSLQRSPFNPKSKPTDFDHEGNFVGVGRRKGRVAFFSPKGSPVASHEGHSAGDMPISVFRSKDLGKPVHIQNVNRTTNTRIRRREAGVPSEWKELQSSQPKPLTNPVEKSRRIAAFRAKKQKSSFTASDFN